MNAVCTIVAKNYFASARVLGESLKSTNPETLYFILLADEIGAMEEFDFAGYSVIEATELGIEKYVEMSYKYDIVEFCTSVKPFLIEYLFNKHPIEKIIFLDPDIIVLTSLGEVFEKLDEYSIVLTPHITTPTVSTIDGRADIEAEMLFLRYGVFNLGFFAINSSEDAGRLVSWWKERLIEECFIDEHTFLFTDQKWMDLLPCLSDKVCILRDSRYNVAWWNLNERMLVLDETGWYIVADGQKEEIALFHFSGFNRHATKGSDSEESSMSDWKTNLLLRIYSLYRDRLRDNDVGTYASLPYAYGAYTNGVAITAFQRRIFRSLLRDGRRFRNPFDAEGEFYRLLRQSHLVETRRLRDAFRAGQRRRNPNKQSRRIERFLRVLLICIGPKNYERLARYCQMKMIAEHQLFLLKK